ncbi:unnamed protein product (macronuclear) [Paramecium tetraurelia]|uniref:Transmembrane protein n=1 Tax=Paramecium tetraurelia TaxID=5888 RepID=A0CUZ0_PARTE|nr:uncharacterized protein GSPATT00010775001 [Paramecium tetraurelia]CAK74607.1 unnamed protein product [Paramecium tetraurelia]|eukprot:XP_001442004.1 hypothetical protein (macronuclear) [Paramecium tetraurelia strain d4-2]
MHLIPLILFMLHKVFWVLLFYQYKKQQTQDRFIKLIQKNLLLKLVSLIYSLYQKLMSTYLFMLLNLFCMTSLRKQIEQFEEEKIMIIHIIINFITIFILLLESLFTLYYFDQSITHQVQDIERTRLTKPRVIYHILILLQIFQVILVNLEYVLYIQTLLVILTQIVLIYDQFKYFTLNLTFQQQPTFIAISINIAFHLHTLIFTQQILNQILLPLLILGMLIFYIINNYNQYFNSLQLKLLFKKEFTSIWQIKYSLIKLMNKDLNSQYSEIIIKSLIASDHRSNCKDVKCCYCGHQYIMYPSQTCGITLQIYREFTMKKMKQFTQLFQLNQKQEFENQVLLQYAFMLYDFGLIMRSVKLLCYLNYNCKNNENNKLNSLSFSRDQITQTHNYDLSTMNQTVLQECFEQNNSLLQMISVYNLKFSYLETVKLAFIFNQAKSKINASLGTSLYAAQKSFISDYIEQNIELDIMLTQKERLIFDLIEQKLQFYQMIVSTTMINEQISVLHNKVYKLCYNLYELQKQMALAYKHKPCFKLHRVVCFFYGEVLCDYKKAIHFFRNSDFFEAQKLQFQHVKNFNINSSNVHYLILEVKDDMETLTVQQFSNKFFHSFGGGVSQTEEHQFNDLLPKYLVQHHCNLVKRFFETGEAKYYQMFDINYIKNKNQLLTPINMCFIITNKFVNQNITFASFLQEASQDQVYIIVDGVSLRCTFTQNLLTLIGWFESDIESLCQQEKYENLQITKIYPNFVRFIRQNKIKYSKLNQSVLILPKPQYNIQTQRSFLSGDAQLTLNYVHTECDLLITKNKIANYEYFVINVVKMAEQQQANHSLVRIPISQPKLNDESKYLVDQTDQVGIEKINAINFYDQNMPQSIANTQIQTTDQNNRKSSINKNMMTIQSFKQQQSLANNNQQLFFADFNNIDQPEQVFAMSNKNDDALVRRKIKKTTIYSEAYLENAQVNKKYQLIQSILAVKSPRYLQKFFFLVVLWHSIFVFFIFLFNISMISDVINLKFLMEMLTFHAAIMAPHDLFFSMRVTITGYQQMQREGFIPQDRLQDLIEPYYQYIDLGFEELKDNFYEQLNNDYLRDFLNDQTITMYFMEENETQIYPRNISFRDALLVILQYQYSQMMTFYYRESTSGKPFQVSLFANYFHLHQQCQNITNTLFNYSKENKDQIDTKWKVISFLGFVIVLLLYIIIQCYQVYYFIQIDMLFLLLNTMSYEMIESEIDKFTNYKNQYKLDRHCLQQYDPIDRSFSYLSKPLKFKGQRYLKLHIGSLNNQKLLNYLILVCLFIVITFYFILIFISSHLYLSKYNDTLNLFGQIQDFKLRTGNLYLYREIFFRWNNFTFLTNQDKNELYTLIDQAQQSIQDYIELSDMVNFNQFLIDDEFISLFHDISKENLCQFIDERFQDLTSRYCYLAFDGTLRQGMISTLNYISNSFKTQQSINNFTKRVEINYYEQEGSQIVTRVFFTLSKQFSQSADSQADFTNTVIKFLSICYFCYIALILAFLYGFYRPYLAWLFKSLKGIVHLIPFEALIFSETLEIQLKELIYRLQLL